MNILNRNNFYNKSTATISLIISVVYLLSIATIPIINNIINTKKNYLSTANKYSLSSNKFLNINKDIETKTEKAVTYINNGQMLNRQIDNNNLQSYVNDAKGSILKLNDFENGANNKTYSYDAYGNVITNSSKLNSKSLSTKIESNLVLNDTNNFIANSFQYNGERFDNNSKLQYLRARFYNPEIKRFINQDSYNLLNRFEYVNGNPVMKSDPNGNNAWNWITDQFKNHTVAASFVTGIAIGICIAVGRKLYRWRQVKNAAPITFPEEESNFLPSDQDFTDSFLRKIDQIFDDNAASKIQRAYRESSLYLKQKDNIGYETKLIKSEIEPLNTADKIQDITNTEHFKKIQERNRRKRFNPQEKFFKSAGTQTNQHDITELTFEKLPVEPEPVIQQSNLARVLAEFTEHRQQLKLIAA